MGTTEGDARAGAVAARHRSLIVCHRLRDAHRAPRFVLCAVRQGRRGRPKPDRAHSRKPHRGKALHKGDTNNNGKIEVSELGARIEKRVPELFAELKQDGWVVKGLAAALLRRGEGEEEDTTQTAHFGSTGEDFAVVARLP
jgi:hypothetical protein